MSNLRERKPLFLYVVIGILVGLATLCVAQHPKAGRSSMQLTSTAFTNGAQIPLEFSCDGRNVSPELSWSGAPPGTKSFVLIMHDPDAPISGGFTHWLVYNMPANVERIPENVPNQDQLPGGGIQGKNGSGKYGYTGPCPPSGTHRYYFKLYALDVILNPSVGSNKEALELAMRGHILAEAELMGRYKRASDQAA
jgi:Raf kinase inhibitor-like YbhB/YbcL family protein